VIDTSAFVAVDRLEGSVDDVVALVGDDELAIASITASELLAGVIRSSPGARRERRRTLVESVIDTISILAFDLQVARVHAELWAQLESTGSRIGEHDLIIAATAISHDLTVLTHNVRHFSRVPGLAVQRADIRS
jgi:predicted nucleic acid-binding protein